ncbi:MAG: hypothetical protein PVG71_15110 [Anaerolineae bacterium]|jgi:hypothetical protein
MKRKTLFNPLMILGVVLALSGSVAWAHEPRTQGPIVQGPLTPQDDVGTGFTYQGRLVDNGTPVDGTCDFRFNLYDDQWLSPSLIAGPVDRSSVAVSDGYFSTGLDFGASAFTGGGRQLEILVRCPAGSGSYTTLSGMVPLNPAPYAHSLRPGAVISGDLAGVTGPNATLYVENTYSGVWASYGLQAKATNGSGVYGESLSSTGVGVEGKAASTGKGVRGETVSGYGVYGEATGGTGVIYGVYGTTNSSSGRGVYGTSASAAGTGVYGHSPSGHGVHGKATPPDGYAIYSEGNTYVEGELFWAPKTSYIAVAAAAFDPAAEGYDFSNNGSSLWNQDSASDFYLAPLQLPHGAIVTKLTFYWWDGSLEDGYCRLYRIDLAGSEWTMATAHTFGSAATSNGSVDSAVDYPGVDNSQYAYYLWLNLPDNLVAAYGAVIEYTVAEPY